MTILSASSNDTILVINRSLTVSEDKHGNLGFIELGDSSISGSIDNKQTEKNIGTSQKYISWSHFFLFYCKAKHKFCNRIFSTR